MSRFPALPLLEPLSPADCRAMGSRVQVWRLKADFVYESDVAGVITAPTGFLTDLASIPREVWAIVAPFDPVCLMPSIPHDKLYTDATGDRKVADLMFREAVMLCGASTALADTMYDALRLFGGSHWKTKAGCRPPNSHPVRLPALLAQPLQPVTLP